MSENAMFGGQRIKIGTCESMYYLRWEDRSRVTPLSGNVNASTDLGLFFRLPFSDEDDVQPGGYTPHNRGYRLGRREVEGNRNYWNDWVPEDAGEMDPGRIQLSHKCGLLISVPCHHGVKLPDLGPITAYWNGKGHSFELSSVKSMPGGVLRPVYNCRWCGAMWSTEWSEVLPFCGLDPVMLARLEAYAVVS